MARPCKRAGGLANQAATGCIDSRAALQLAAADETMVVGAAVAVSAAEAVDAAEEAAEATAAAMTMALPLLAKRTKLLLLLILLLTTVAPGPRSAQRSRAESAGKKIGWFFCCYFMWPHLLLLDGEQ